MDSIEEKKAELCLRYLKLLQEGRIKPDRKGGDTGIIRDSLDNIQEIKHTKKRIHELLGIKNEI